MDHAEAMRCQAAEKYALGQLPQNLREEYEEHFFNCVDCALELKAAVAFVSAGREVFREERVKKLELAGSRERVPGSAGAFTGWMRWFRPIVAVPAFGLLAAVLIYQNVVTIPQARQSSNGASAQIISSSFQLVGDARRGGNGEGAGEEESNVKIQVRPGESFLLRFDFLPQHSFSRYLSVLQDEQGHALLQTSFASGKEGQALQLSVPKGVEHPGKYSLVLFGDPDGTEKQVRNNEVQSFIFTIEFLS